MFGVINLHPTIKNVGKSGALTFLMFSIFSGVFPVFLLFEVDVFHTNLTDVLEFV